MLNYGEFWILNSFNAKRTNVKYSLTTSYAILWSASSESRLQKKSLALMKIMQIVRLLLFQGLQWRAEFRGSGRRLTFIQKSIKSIWVCLRGTHHDAIQCCRIASDDLPLELLLMLDIDMLQSRGAYYITDFEDIHYTKYIYIYK